MFTFNGTAKTITINDIELVGGVVSFTIEQLWTEWNTWVGSNITNLIYPIALRQSGGDVISPTQNIGIAMFLNNVAGWRIIPPNGTCKITVVGSLYGESKDLPLLTNRVGQDTTFEIEKSALALEINNDTAPSITLEVLQEELRKLSNLVVAMS